MTAPSGPDEADLPDVVRRYLEAYNRRDVDAMLECLSDDVRFSNISGRVVTDATEGKDAFAALARVAVTLFSSREQTVRAAITVAGTTLARVDYRAVPARDLPNGWRAGDEVALSGRSLFELHEGRIRRLIDEI